jgi:drug/metabolite transporter (DMT)-like permease
VLAALRLSVASLVLLPALRGLRKATQAGSGAMRYAVFAGVFLALHFGFWITSLAYTSIAASATIVTSTPVWIALILWAWRGEVPSRLTAGGIALALAGGATIALGDAGGASAGSNPLLGELLALAGALAVSLYLIFGGEAQRQGLSVGRYVAVVYGVGALALLPAPMLFGAGYLGWPWGVYLCGVLLALIPQLVGHTALNWSVRWVGPTLVALVVLAEPVCGSLLGYAIFGEVPGLPVLLGAAVLLSGVTAAVLGERPANRPEGAAPHAPG